MHAMHSASARSEEHIDDVDAQLLPRQDVLIQPWSSTDSRLYSPVDPILSSAAPSHSSQSSPAAAILPHLNTFTNNNGQDVRVSLSADSGPQNTSTANFHDDRSPRTFESPALPSSFSTYHHDSVNTLTSRPRTGLPIFGSTSKLAAHYGIPTKLPPAPSVNINKKAHTRPPVPRFNETVPSSSSRTTVNTQYQQPAAISNPISDFQCMFAGYISMLKNNHEENGNASASAMPPSPATASYVLQPSVEEAAQSMDMLFGGAADFTSPQWDEYLTSPFIDDESPFEALLNTPANSNLNDFLNSPVVADVDVSANSNFVDMPLFPQPGSGYSESTNDFAKMTLVSPPCTSSSGSASPSKPAAPNFDELYSMSPATPALEPPSTQTSPFIDDMSTSSPNADAPGRRKKIPTGTRKNVMPESLVPLDAPTQPRNYVLPSSTSRKAIPAVFARKRARSAAFGGEEEDELAGSDGGALDASVTLTEADAIAAKRRQNTIAARRSRKRKLEYQRELEEGMEAERREKEMWRERAMMLRAQVMQLGMPEPFREA